MRSSRPRSSERPKSLRSSTTAERWATEQQEEEEQRRSRRLRRRRRYSMPTSSTLRRDPCLPSSCASSRPSCPTTCGERTWTTWRRVRERERERALEGGRERERFRERKNESAPSSILGPGGDEKWKDIRQHCTLPFFSSPFRSSRLASREASRRSAASKRRHAMRVTARGSSRLLGALGKETEKEERTRVFPPLPLRIPLELRPPPWRNLYLCLPLLFVSRPRHLPLSRCTRLSHAAVSKQNQ